jgi:hypothetical protein
VEEMIINGDVYRLVTVRGRSKWVSKDGRAYNVIKFNQKASTHINRDGYPCFGGGVPVHLYVAYGWVDGYFEGAEVDHIDYDRTNYNSDNLRWVTHTENILHSSVDENRYLGKHCGGDNGRATLSNDEVKTAKELFQNGLSTMEVVRRSHPDYSYQERKSVWNRYNRIKNNETWNNI